MLINGCSSAAILPDAVQLFGFRGINSWLQGVKIPRCSYISAPRDIFGNFSHSRRSGLWVSVFASSVVSPPATLFMGERERDETARPEVLI